jgi:hypothetical protein
MMLQPIPFKTYTALIDTSIYPRTPWLGEVEWHASPDMSRIGVVIFDNADNDYSWVLIARKSRTEWEAIDLGHSGGRCCASRATTR